MAKQPLLDMVQDILYSLDSDEVNSINDTVEAFQVAQIIKSVYFELISRRDWPHLKELFQLESSGDNTKPTHTKIPENVQEVRNVNYNKRVLTDNRDKYLEVVYLEPDKFLWLTNQRDTNATDVDTITDFSGVDVQVLNDQVPTYWTSFDDEYIIFDSYDSAVDTTIQTSKTQCFGLRQPTFSMADNFVPDLPIDAFPMLLAESKSVAHVNLKQQVNEKAEQQATRQRFRMSRKSWKANSQSRYPNYGRKAGSLLTNRNPRG